MILEQKTKIIKEKFSENTIPSWKGSILCYSWNHNFEVLSWWELDLFIFLEDLESDINVEVLSWWKAYIKVLVSPKAFWKVKSKIVWKISWETAFVDIYIAWFAFDKASLDIDWNIIITKEASSWIAHLKQENIILWENPIIRWVPNLFAYNNDIEASHSCSISTIKDEDIFYLSSRLIPPSKAKEMMIFSYIDNVFWGAYNDYENEILEIKEKIISQF